MENSYFIFSDINQNIKIERFHICTWEFQNNTSFIEFGCEISKNSLQDQENIELQLFAPWLTVKCQLADFYEKLKGSENSRFIFNESITSTDFLDGGQNLNGVVHNFSGRNRLCILPITLLIDGENQTITIKINLDFYNKTLLDNRPNIYFRFSVTPEKILIATRKNGIAKSTILYDIRLNQKRNLPESLIPKFVNKEVCKIERCFCFNIVPNRYELVFFDASSLQSVRTLEYPSFNRYLPDKRIKENELLVVYSRKDGADAYNFFLIYSKEYIGMDQLAIGLLISLISGILLFIPAYKVSLGEKIKYSELWAQMPFLFWVVVFLVAMTLFYFAWKKFRK
jgi:hypothetical protein